MQLAPAGLDQLGGGPAFIKALRDGLGRLYLNLRACRLADSEGWSVADAWLRLNTGTLASSGFDPQQLKQAREHAAAEMGHSGGKVSKKGHSQQWTPYGRHCDPSRLLRVHAPA